MISPLLETPTDGDNAPDDALPPVPAAAAHDDPSTDDPLARMEALMAAGERDAAFAHAEAAIAGRRSSSMTAGLARCLIDMGEPARAAALIEPLAADGGAGADALTVMARALGLCGRHQEALSLLTEASWLDSRSPEVLLALANARFAADDVSRAIGDFERVLRIATGDGAREAEARAEAHFRLGEAWGAMDEPARAARHFRAAQENDPADRRGAAIRLAEMDAAGPPKRASAAYVRALFDGYAPRYDTHMTGALAYKGPAALKAAAEAAGLSLSGGYRAIDLGCGTGLSGAAFRPFCAWLTGVDLSPRMTAAAEASGHYDAVATGDLLTALAEAGEARFDLALACDTLIYLGDLAPLFAALRKALAPQGFFVFSTEKAGPEADGYEIGATRRFRHTERYLREMAAAHGFEVVSLGSEALRTEKRQPVESFVGVMRRG